MYWYGMNLAYESCSISVNPPPAFSQVRGFVNLHFIHLSIRTSAVKATVESLLTYKGVACLSAVAVTAEWKSMADNEERNQACRLCDVDGLWPESASWNQRSQWQWLPDLHGLENN